MVSVNDILNNYPHCQQAVAFIELMICIPPDDEDRSTWDIMMNTKTPIPINEVLEILRGVIQDEIDCGSEGRHKEALEQTYHPSFMTYIGSKMGMV